ncbi:MAG TPA: hypothetical protein VFL57_02210, partial [Bryobacteraceae bacterium]|nr:hypothetical protein [Bryobacteraceae bacterium]
MKIGTWLCMMVLAVGAVATSQAGTFGKVVAIGGHASDLALDEGRGVLYIANFTANRVDVMSLSDNSVRTAINVPSQPSALALSPDARFLVVAHYGNFAAGMSPANALTVITLDTGAKQTFALGAPPFGVAFGIDGRALVVTSTEYLLFDPESGSTELIGPITSPAPKTLPQPTPTTPVQITGASVAASRDGLWIYGVTDTFWFGYDVAAGQIVAGNYVASPPLGPRAVSVADNGSIFTAGWALFEGVAGGRRFSVLSQFPNPTGDLQIGSHAIDSSRGLIYVQIGERPRTSGTGTGSGQGGSGTGSTGGSGSGGSSGGGSTSGGSTGGGSTSGGSGTGGTTAPTTPAAPPVLQIVDADNLAVIERMQLAENLSGKSVLSGDYSTMYSVSDSGVTVLPVGSWQQARRIVSSQEDVIFRGNFCDRRAASQDILITDPSGAATDFTLAPDAGVRVVPAFGTTPARVRITVDPNSFATQKGTTAAKIQIKSTRAANLPNAIRVLINTREPDQRGTFYNVPGKLVDILSDPTRDRFFVLRQDKNQVLVFDGVTYTQVATLKTGNTPTQMAISFDRKYLLIGSDNSQLIFVYDLETLEPLPWIRMPLGHYPRSIAASGKAVLAATRVAGSKHTIDRVDLASGVASELPSLGVFTNDINIDTMLVASANGSSILAAQADGTMMLYNANADTFTISRRDGTPLSGAYAASSYDQFVVGNKLLNSSLVPMAQLETGTGQSSGFVFLDGTGLRMTAPSAAAAGIMQRVDTRSGEGSRATRTVEAPLLSDFAGTSTAFTRTLAPLASGRAIVALTTSGFTVLPWNYDAAVAPPRISRVVNAADNSETVAAGGLVSIFGSSLSPVTETTSQAPLPTLLGESCLTVNGTAVPMIYVSSSQINAQLPYTVEGSTTLTLRTPGGVSDNFNLTISPAAPSIFKTSLNGGPEVATIIRAVNSEVVTPSNPVHRGDTLTIYATGLGRTSPAVENGGVAPSEPLASAIIVPQVTLGGVPVQVTFAGLTPGQIG